VSGVFTIQQSASCSSTAGTTPIDTIQTITLQYNVAPIEYTIAGGEWKYFKIQASGKEKAVTFVTRRLDTQSDPDIYYVAPTSYFTKPSVTQYDKSDVGNDVLLPVATDTQGGTLHTMSCFTVDSGLAVQSGTHILGVYAVGTIASTISITVVATQSTTSLQNTESLIEPSSKATLIQAQMMTLYLQNTVDRTKSPFNDATLFQQSVYQQLNALFELPQDTATSSSTTLIHQWQIAAPQHSRLVFRDSTTIPPIQYWTNGDSSIATDLRLSFSIWLLPYQSALNRLDTSQVTLNSQITKLQSFFATLNSLTSQTDRDTLATQQGLSVLAYLDTTRIKFQTQNVEQCSDGLYSNACDASRSLIAPDPPAPPKSFFQTWLLPILGIGFGSMAIIIVITVCCYCSRRAAKSRKYEAKTPRSPAVDRIRSHNRTQSSAGGRSRMQRQGESDLKRRSQLINDTIQRAQHQDFEQQEAHNNNDYYATQHQQHQQYNTQRNYIPSPTEYASQSGTMLPPHLYSTQQMHPNQHQPIYTQNYAPTPMPMQQQQHYDQQLNPQNYNSAHTRQQSRF
jgi:hypothetical protein